MYPATKDAYFGEIIHNLILQYERYKKSLVQDDLTKKRQHQDYQVKVSIKNSQYNFVQNAKFLRKLQTYHNHLMYLLLPCAACSYFNSFEDKIVYIMHISSCHWSTEPEHHQAFCYEQFNFYEKDLYIAFELERLWHQDFNQQIYWISWIPFEVILDILDLIKRKPEKFFGDH